MENEKFPRLLFLKFRKQNDKFKSNLNQIQQLQHVSQWSFKTLLCFVSLFVIYVKGMWGFEISFYYVCCQNKENRLNLINSKGQ